MPLGTSVLSPSSPSLPLTPPWSSGFFVCFFVFLPPKYLFQSSARPVLGTEERNSQV